MRACGRRAGIWCSRREVPAGRDHGCPGPVRRDVAAPPVVTGGEAGAGVQDVAQPFQLGFGQGRPGPAATASPAGWRRSALRPALPLNTATALVVRGAGAAGRSGFPIPLSIRTCGFHACGLPMIFLAWLRCLRKADGASQAIQAVPAEPPLVPLPGLPSVQVAAPLLDHQAAEPPDHVSVGLAELGVGVPGAEVAAPAAQDRVQIRDHLTDCSALTDPQLQGRA